MLGQFCFCRQKFKFSDSAAGTKAECKKCGAVFTIEASQESPAPLDEIGLFDVIAETTQRAKAAHNAAP